MSVVGQQHNVLFGNQYTHHVQLYAHCRSNKYGNEQTQGVLDVLLLCLTRRPRLLMDVVVVVVAVVVFVAKLACPYSTFVEQLFS